MDSAITIKLDDFFNRFQTKKILLWVNYIVSFFSDLRPLSKKIKERKPTKIKYIKNIITIFLIGVPFIKVFGSLYNVIIVYLTVCIYKIKNISCIHAAAIK